MPLIRPSLVWPLTAVVAAASAYAVVRTALTTTAAPAAAGVATTAKTAEPRSAAEIDAARTAAAEAEDALVRRLRFLERVEKADPAELRKLFLSGQTTSREQRAIAQRWAESDPAGLFDFLKSLSRSEWDRDAGQHDAVRGILFRTWARQDADAALAAADSLERRPHFRGARWEIVQSLFSTDPAKALAAAAGLPAWSSGDPLPESVWKNDPASFLKAAGEASTKSLKNELVRAAVVDAFAAWVKQNPGAAAEWLKSRPPDQQRRLWGRLASRMADADPAAAQAWFQDLPPSAEREDAGAQIVGAWAKKDPRAALEWLQDNLEGGRTQAFAGVAEALAEKGAEDAKQLLEAMPPGNQRDEVVAAIARTWSNKEFKPAMDWVLSLPPDDPGRRRAMEHLGYQWAEKDLAGAAAYVQAHADQPETRNIRSAVTSQFSEKDLGAGLAWAASLPPQAQDRIFMDFWMNSFHQKRQPEVIAAVEKLPAPQQAAVVERLVVGTLRTNYGDPDQDARFLNALKFVPDTLRDTARRAVEKAESASPERKQAALEVLK
jgi:hypothetical protein